MDDIISKAVYIRAKSGISMRVSAGFLLLLAAVTLVSGVRMTAAVVLAAAVHELGHMAVVYMCGGRIGGVSLGAAGAELRVEGELSYLEDAAVALSGPLAGGLLAFGAGCLSELAGGEFLCELCAVSVLYTTFNLLPMGSMDGGGALYALSCQFFGPFAADRICLVSDILCGALLLFGGCAVFFVTRGNFSALLCAFFVIISCCKRI